MKNSILDNEVKVLGETADRDLTSQLQDQLDGMFDDELEQSVIGLKGRANRTFSALRWSLGVCAMPTWGCARSAACAATSLHPRLSQRAPVGAFFFGLKGRAKTA